MKQVSLCVKILKLRVKKFLLWPSTKQSLKFYNLIRDISGISVGNNFKLRSWADHFTPTVPCSTKECN